MMFILLCFREKPVGDAEGLVVFETLLTCHLFSGVDGLEFRLLLIPKVANLNHRLIISKLPKPPQDFNFSSIANLHLGPNLFIAQTTAIQLPKQITPRPVNNHPFPIALINGWATTPPTQEKIFLTKLLIATPELFCLGMNSVNMVVESPNTIMEPKPKKKFATMGTIQRRPCCDVQPYQIKPQG
jgi:hypothetical protein